MDTDNRASQRAQDLLKELSAEQPPEVLFAPDEREALKARLRETNPSTATGGESIADPPESDG